MKKIYKIGFFGDDVWAHKALDYLLKDKSIIERIEILPYISHEEAIKHILESEIGILVNSEKNIHSTRYTSPLKYFEYLYAGLSIVAVNFKAHKILPYSESINFFDIDNKNQFIEAILKASVNYDIDKNRLTLDFRSKKIIYFLPN